QNSCAQTFLCRTSCVINLDLLGLLVDFLHVRSDEFAFLFLGFKIAQLHISLIGSRTGTEPVYRTRICPGEDIVSDDIGSLQHAGGIAPAHGQLVLWRRAFILEWQVPDIRVELFCRGSTPAINSLHRITDGRDGQLWMRRTAK